MMEKEAKVWTREELTPKPDPGLVQSRDTWLVEWIMLFLAVAGVMFLTGWGLASGEATHGVEAAIAAAYREGYQDGVTSEKQLLEAAGWSSEAREEAARPFLEERCDRCYSLGVDDEIRGHIAKETYRRGRALQGWSE